MIQWTAILNAAFNQRISTSWSLDLGIIGEDPHYSDSSLCDHRYWKRWCSMVIWIWVLGPSFKRTCTVIMMGCKISDHGMNVNKSEKDWRMTLQLFASKLYWKCWSFESSKQASTHNKPVRWNYRIKNSEHQNKSQNIHLNILSAAPTLYQSDW